MAKFFRSLANLAKRIAYYYPLTWLGTLLWCISLFLLAQAYLDLSPFSLLLALVALLVLIIGSLMTRLQASSFSRQSLEWDTSAPLYAQQLDLKHYVYSESIRSWLFFRLHFRVKGKFSVEKDKYYYFFQEKSSSMEERLAIPMYFPVCGILQAHGRFFIKDVLGLCQARMGKDLARTLFVRPAPGVYKKQLPLLAREGFENTSRQKDANEEKYYQREYMPGDRFRDINWKVFSRINQLVTKISHITQEKSRLLTIYFRHYKAETLVTADALAHINFLKSWLLLFLKTVKKDVPAYNFQIFTGQGVTLLETEEDLERFGLDLISLHYQFAPGGLERPGNAGEVFIFTTPYDTQLPHVIAALAGVRINLFRTLFAPPVQTGPADQARPDAARKDASPAAASGRAESGRAEPVLLTLLRPLLVTPLPGLWFLTRDNDLKNPALPVYERGLYEEVPIQVKLI